MISNIRTAPILMMILLFATAVYADHPPRKPTIFDFPATRPTTPGPVDLPTTPTTMPATQPATAPVAAVTPTSRPIAPVATKPIVIKHEVPSAGDIANTLLQVADAYPGVNAKSPVARVGAASQLLDAVPADTEHPNEQYAMLVQARDIYASVGDAAGAVATVEMISRQFSVDALKMRCDAALAAGRSATAGPVGKIDRLCDATVLIDAADAAMAAGRFDMAGPLDSRAAALAVDAGDAGLIREINAHLRELAEMRSAWIDANPPKPGPSTPSSRLAEGRLRCLTEGDWTGGLPLLAAGSDATLAAAARSELAGQAGVAADAWWNYAASPAGAVKEHPLAHRQLIAHVAALYTLAEPSSTSLARLRIQKRLETIAADPPIGAVHHRVDLLRRVNLTRDVVDGNWNQTASGSLIGTGNRQGRLAVIYNPPVAYDVQVEFTRAKTTDKKDESVGVYCVGNGRQFLYLFGTDSNTVCGINVVDGKYSTDNGFAVRAGIPDGRRTVATIHIRPGSLAIDLDGHLLSHRDTDFANFGLAPEQLLPLPDAIGFEVYTSTVEIFSAVAIELDDRHFSLPVSDITVVSARWGGGSNWADVTARVTQLKNAHMHIWANNGMLGADPTPGWRKHLEVTYTRAGQQAWVGADEDQRLKFPDEE